MFQFVKILLLCFHAYHYVTKKRGLPAGIPLSVVLLVQVPSNGRNHWMHLQKSSASFRYTL